MMFTATKCYSFCTVLMIIYSHFACGIFNAKYIKTLILIEKERCINKNYNRKLVEITAKTTIQCSERCSVHPNCRRLLFNLVEQNCMLFEAGENCIVLGNVSHYVCYRQKHVCDDTSCIRCPMGYYGDTCQNIIKDCSEGMVSGFVPLIKTLAYLKPVGEIIEALCNFKSGGGYTVIQHRTYDCMAVDFNKTWDEYASGFGNAYGSHWLGLRHVHDILHHSSQSFELHVKSGTISTSIQCFYLLFDVADESNNFKITIDSYHREDAPEVALGNSLTLENYTINGQPFSTYDRDYSGGCPATRNGGGWWYLDAPKCLLANPTGLPDQLQWLDNKEVLTDYTKLRLRLKKI